MSQPQPATPRVRHTQTRARPQRTWTTREEEYLRDRYRTRTVAQIAAHLKRSTSSVKSKASDLGLSKRILATEDAVTGEYYRVSRVAEGLGVPETQVWRWIGARWLPMHAQWIAGVDLAAFLAAHPSVVDTRRMTREQRLWMAALVGHDERQKTRGGRTG